MSQQTDNIASRLLQIRDETTPAANTATRVGQVLIDMLRTLESQDRPEYLRRDRDDATPHTLGVGRLEIGTGERKVVIETDADGRVRVGGDLYAMGAVSALGAADGDGGGGAVSEEVVEAVVERILEEQGLTLEQVWQSLTGASADAWADEKVSAAHLSTVDTGDIYSMWNA